MNKRFLSLAIVLAALTNLKAQHIIVSEANDSTMFLKSETLQKVTLRFPENYDPQKTYPLLIALHGNGGTAKDMASIFVPFKHKEVIVAIPEGQYPRVIKESIGFSWYYYTNNIQLSILADVKTVEQVLLVINELTTTYKIQNTFVMGFSQGASLAYLMGFKYPQMVDGVIAVGGGLPTIDGRGSIVTTRDILNAKDLKVLVSRGNKDKHCTKKNFNEQKNFLEQKGLVTTSFEYKGEHYLTAEFLETVFVWINDLWNTNQSNE